MKLKAAATTPDFIGRRGEPGLARGLNVWFRLARLLPLTLVDEV